MDTMNRMNATCSPRQLQPICNLELERMVIALLVNSYHANVETSDILFEDCFYDEKMRDIFRAIKSICGRGSVPDHMLVINELKKVNSKVTGVDVAELCCTSAMPFDIKEHALLLRDLSIRRNFRRICADSAFKADDRSVSVEAMQSECRDSLNNIFDFDCAEDVTMEDTFKEFVNVMLTNDSRQEGEIYGTPTGFPEIDKDGGLCATDLVVVGAETSQGKTSFATALALSAVEHGEDVAFYSMEMLPVQLTARIVAMRSGISSKHLLRDKVSVEEFDRTGDSVRGLDMSKLHFDGKSISSLDSILMSIRRKKMKLNIKGVVIDYLQLVRPENMKLNREQAIGDIARSFKNLAKELNIWIILISQLSRDRQNPVPSLARLRDSGQIEEAADVIFLIHRPRDGQRYPEPYADVITQGTALISVAKGRNIGTSQFICGFEPTTTSFHPLSPHDLADMRRVTDTDSGASASPLTEQAPF